MFDGVDSSEHLLLRDDTLQKEHGISEFVFVCSGSGIPQIHVLSLLPGSQKSTCPVGKWRILFHSLPKASGACLEIQRFENWLEGFFFSSIIIRKSYILLPLGLASLN